MNIGNELNSGTKILKKKMKYKKISIKKNLQIIDDPAFHLNRTLKAYVNNRLNKNSSTEIIDNLRKSEELWKFNNSFNRSQTLSNIINKKKYLSNNKINTIKKVSHSSKSRKKLKSTSSNKFNLSQYILFYKNKNPNITNKINKINKNKILKKNSNNSQKYIRYSGSTALSNNDTNQILDKNNSIIPYNINNNNYNNNNYNNNQIISNHSSLDINIVKSPILGQTTSKKTKFSNQFFNKKINDKYINTNLINSKFNKYININLVKKRQNLTKYYSNNLSINNKNLDINVDNNNKYCKVNNNKDKNLHKNNNNLRNSYTLSNNNNTPQKILNNTINISNINKNNNISSNNINSNNIKENNNIENKEKNEYLKKIEMLENENKLLKSEINDSKNKLLLLESKINELIIGKNSLEKEECPQPTPYVKKYSLETLSNLDKSPFTFNDNKEMEDKKIIINKNEEINKSESKENNYLNKIQKNLEPISIKIKTQKPKLTHLNTSKSIFLTKEKNSIDTPTKINVNKYSRNIVINRKEKKKTCKKINNLKKLYYKNKSQNKFYTEENIKK